MQEVHCLFSSLLCNFHANSGLSLLWGEAASAQPPFSQLLREAGFGDSITETLTVQVYVRSEGILRLFHRHLVFVTHGMAFTMELSRHSTGRAKRKVRTLDRNTLPVAGCSGQIVTTPKDLSLIADNVVQEMGSYNVLTSNCQHFCNKMVDACNLPGLKCTTTAEIAFAFVGLVLRQLLSW